VIQAGGEALRAEGVCRRKEPEGFFFPSSFSITDETERWSSFFLKISVWALTLIISPNESGPQ